MYRPFRILLVDDALSESLRSSEVDEDAADRARRATGGLLGLTGRVVRLGDAAAKARSGSLELYLTGEVSFRENRPKALVRALRGERPSLRTSTELCDFLQSIDVLLLDLQGVGSPPEPYQATASSALGATESDLRSLNSVFGGAGFYLGARTTALRECQAIVILSAYDPHGSQDVPAEVRSFLHPFCDAADSRPWTVKWSTEESHLSLVGDLVEGLFEAFSSGYVSLHSLGAIEFAATHDLPVLIVGESGTGKEYIARQIHRRWVREKSRSNPDADGLDRFQVVNCAGLSSELSRSELFGHVRGSFTDAGEHRLGVVLSGCGLTPPLSRKGKTKDAFEGAKRLKTLAEVMRRFDELNTSATREEAAEFAYRNWSTVLNTFGTEYAHSLLAEIGEIANKLQEKARSVDYVEQFQRLLVQANKRRVGRAASGEYDLEILGPNGATNREPLGTLFLDEFAELPLDVATLLLRYLQGFEVQPLGYPGTLLGARMRIVAATSDPRIAQLAGVTDLLGTWRSRAELDLPVRQDLVFRVMGQVIRAEPVKPESAEGIVSQMVAAFAAKETPEWSSAAVARLGVLVRRRLESMKAAGEAETAEKSVFGHRRQLAMFIDLVNSFVGTAHNRGIRSIGENVTEAVVTSLWRSSSVSSWSVQLPNGEQLKARSRADAWSPEELKARFSEDGKRFALVWILYQRMQDSPGKPVAFKGCIAAVNAANTGGKPLKNRNALYKLKNQVNDRLSGLGSGLMITSKKNVGYYMERQENA